MSYLALCLMMVFLVACFIASRLMNAGVVAIFTKTMASLGMVIGGILALSNGYAFYYLYIIIGLICGMLGDVFLELKKNYKDEDLTYCNLGITGLALGLILYLVGMIRMVEGAVSLWLESIISLVIAVAFASLLILVLSKPLKLNFGKCKWQSFGYCILLTFVTVFSIFIYVKARISILLPLGFISFLLSDLILSMQYFGGEGKIDQPILVIANHVLYYGAQVLLVGVLYNF